MTLWLILFIGLTVCYAALWHFDSDSKRERSTSRKGNPGKPDCPPEAAVR